MKISLITYCSKDKDSSEGLLPASERYLSSRIQATHTAASSLGVSCHILSGLYGLMEPDHEIPYYDHLLTADLVPAHVELLEKQLREANLEQVIFISRTVEVDPGTAAYRQAITTACRQAGIGLKIFEIEAGPPDPAELTGSMKAFVELLHE